MSEIKPVYPEYHKDSVRFQLFSDGKVMARTRDLPAREAFRLTNAETGEAWTPGHKAFNSLCREAVREGDVDDLIAEQRRVSEARGMKRKAGEELYEALAAFERTVDLWLPADSEVSEEHYGEAEALAGLHRAMVAALAKARGENS